MGLDVTAYSKVEFAEVVSSYVDFEQRYEGVDAVWVEAAGYYAHLPPLKNGGVYCINGETFTFRAGSYSVYNWWRNELSIKFIGVSARGVWNEPVLYRDKPFFMLVNFSDCEGCIGSETAVVLADAFDTYADVVFAEMPPEFHATYQRFHRAFRLASDDGLVRFW